MFNHWPGRHRNAIVEYYSSVQCAIICLIHVTATFTSSDLILFSMLGGGGGGGGARSRDRKVVGFITTYAISAYHH
jgi:hypothetical protein